MQESFLHFIWKFQYFSKRILKTNNGEAIEILNQGIHNTDGGPDFKEAKIDLDGISWHGHVEIHIKSSDWYRHKHQHDKAYDNVVLHVVWSDDKPVKRSDGTDIPTIELKDRIEKSLLIKHQKLVGNENAIACAEHLPRVEVLTRMSMFDKVIMSRLENKAENVKALLIRNNDNWEETTFQLLARNFGFKVNAESFERLSQLVPLRLLTKHIDHPIQIESLLFGSAGFLEADYENEYFQRLKKEYTFLSKKYSLQGKEMIESRWNFLRLRPANFPTIRIAQMASLIHKQQSLFSLFLNVDSFKEVSKKFRIKQSDFWCDHYHFNKPTERKIAGIGKASIENIIINTIAPLLVCYGKVKNEQHYIDRAVEFLQNIPPEINRITRKWTDIGIAIESAFDSQASIQLYNDFCKRKRCLECNIGVDLINTNR